MNVVVYSGGLDSTCMLALTPDPIALSFSYGQKAQQELQCAMNITSRLDIEHNIIDISFLKEIYSNSNSLTSEAVEIPDKVVESTIVPFRNGIFLSLAVAYAQIIGAGQVIIGSHTNDKPYPDCTPQFTDAFAKAAYIASRVKVVSPAVLGLSKADLIARAYPKLKELTFETLSCYRGRPHCGTCQACTERQKAFQIAGILDKTKYKKT